MRGEVRGGTKNEDQYLDRVAKYVPTEVVGGYVSLDGILSAQPAAASGAIPTLGGALGATLGSVSGAIFLFCLVAAPLYIYVVARRTGAAVWRAQALIAALAFIVWAYAIKGSVFFNPHLQSWAKASLNQSFYDPRWSAALLVLFSMAVALYQPKID